MEDFITQITPPLLSILGTILITVFAWVGVRIKSWLDTDTKRTIAEQTVKYVEQVGQALGSEEKLALAKKQMIEMLGRYNIKITETELNVLIEAAVQSFYSHYEE